jgi:hypothetical protein
LSPAVYSRRNEPLNQGDIFKEVPFTSPHGDDRRTLIMEGMVTSHDCDCDKYFHEVNKGAVDNPDGWPVIVVPVYPIEQLQGGQDGNARLGKIRRWFYLPADQGRSEYVADFWFEQPIPIVQLLARERVASLSHEWRQRLHIHIWEMRTRVPAADAFRGKTAYAP